MHVRFETRVAARLNNSVITEMPMLMETGLVPRGPDK